MVAAALARGDLALRGGIEDVGDLDRGLLVHVLGAGCSRAAVDGEGHARGDAVAPAQKAAAVKDAGKSVVKAAVTAAPPTRTAAKAAPVAPHLCPAKAAPRGVVRLAQANPDGSPAAVTAELSKRERA